VVVKAGAADAAATDFRNDRREREACSWSGMTSSVEKGEGGPSIRGGLAHRKPVSSTREIGPWAI
jgi:hypothetical protein